MRHDDITPVVSVLLPVYNAGTYLQESVESILKQIIKIKRLRGIRFSIPSRLEYSIDIPSSI